MSINKKIIVTVAAGMVLGVSSCRKFLDVNTNPNIAPTATVQTLLPAGQLYITSSLGVDLQITGSMWAGFWTQSPNSSQYTSPYSTPETPTSGKIFGFLTRSSI